MRKLYPNSRMEIWNTPHINSIGNCRAEKDRNVDIVQIEAGSGEVGYIVEIVEKGGERENS